MLSDEDILERGGSQEDINAYAHDVGGACGAVYGGRCDHCGKVGSMKDTETVTLDEILNKAIIGKVTTHQPGMKEAAVETRIAYQEQVKAAIIKLFEQAVESAKPEEVYCGFHGGKANRATCATCHPMSMVDRYQQNLLQALSNSGGATDDEP